MPIATLSRPRAEEAFPEEMHEFVDDPQRTALPDDAHARRVRIVDCPNLTALPADLRVRHLEVRNCPGLTTLPAGLRCHQIDAPGSAFTELPDGLRVDFRLDLCDSPALTRLPRGLRVGSLILRGCTALEALPEGLDVSFL